MTEEAVLFGKARSLVGIVTDPQEVERKLSLPAIILLNAGLLYRVGPNRLYVKMARSLARMGFVVLRFDLSGIGDSKVRGDDLPVEKRVVGETQEAMSVGEFLERSLGERVIGETQEAMDYLSETRGIKRFVLMGICSGAILALWTACCDPRVVGAVLINIPGHVYATSGELNRTMLRHYLRIALSSSFRSKNFLKIIKGKFNYRSVIKVMASQMMSLFARKSEMSSGANNGANSIAADLRSLAERGVRLLLIHSEGDEGLDYLEAILGEKIRELIENGRLRVEVIRGANHIFTLLSNQEELIEAVRNWTQATLRH